MSHFFVGFFLEDDGDEINLHMTRYRPEELDKLAKTTKFTRKEIQLIYRGFKQVGFSSVCSLFRVEIMMTHPHEIFLFHIILHVMCIR